jgi:hypothetical protein
MSARQSDVSEDLIGSGAGPAMDREVVRRATQLCLRAEPHTDSTPCTAHRNEATRQLLDLPG